MIRRYLTGTFRMPSVFFLAFAWLTCALFMSTGATVLFPEVPASASVTYSVKTATVLTYAPWSTCVPRAIRYYGMYREDNDLFAGNTQRYCIKAVSPHTITLENNGKPSRAGIVVAYPRIYAGQNYTSGDTESGMPEPVSDLRNLTLHVVSRGHAEGGWQSDSDDWFSRSKATASRHGDVEMVIVTRHSRATYSNGFTRYHGPDWWTVRLGGRYWDVTSWIAGRGSLHWRLVYYTPAHGATISHTIPLRLASFTGYATHRGWLPRSQWLDSAAFGTEIWSGGRGLTDSMTITGLPPVIRDGA